MKTIHLLLLVMLSFTSLAAQEKCPLPEAPSALGLKLNMPADEVQNVFGRNLKINVKNDNERIIFENFIDKKPPPPLSGVRALYLRFIDRRLYQIEVFYEETPQVKTLQDFAASVSGRLNFPVSAWQEEGNKLVVNCGDYTVAATKTLNPRLELTDLAARAKVEAIREKESQKD